MCIPLLKAGDKYNGTDFDCTSHTKASWAKTVRLKALYVSAALKNTTLTL
jgi:hypothetical protein